MIDLKDFKSIAGTAVWKRGMSYFDDGAVVDLSCKGNGQWQAFVEGSEDYEVSKTACANVQVEFGEARIYRLSKGAKGICYGV